MFPEPNGWSGRVRPGVAMAAGALLIASGPAAAIVPVEDPGQWLARMQGAELMLASPAGEDLMKTFFTPRSPNDRPCEPPEGRLTGVDMVCEYAPPNGTGPALFLSVAGGLRAARITGVVWRYPLPGRLWRCRRTGAQGGWHVCFPAGSDRRGDARGFGEWDRLLRSLRPMTPAGSGAGTAHPARKESGDVR